MTTKLLCKPKAFVLCLFFLALLISPQLFANNAVNSNEFSNTTIIDDGETALSDATVSDQPEKSNETLPITNSLDNLYTEGDAADPYNETNSVGNWQLDEDVSPDQISFQSVPGGSDGLYSIMVKSEGWGFENWGRIMFTIDDLDPNKSYRFSWDAKSNDGSSNVGSGFVLIAGTTEDEMSFRPSSTEWSNFSACLVPRSTSITLKIYPTAGVERGEEFYIDNLIVVEDGCDDCVVGSNANDMDCDGVPTDEDCDDNDPNVGSNANDMDCDGVPTDEDCDDNDPNVGSNANDMDCDGVPTDEDCDDNDPNVGSNANDMDCDGVPTDEDCDDNDPNVGSNANDMDCDGVPTDEDCDDNDPNVGSNANDMDCDGVPTDEDCDDNDPNVGSNANDMDCDGVPTDEDCDDNDPNVGSNANDMDCDGVPTDEDCDDNDPNVGSNANDMDCDGVPTDEDCDDNDPNVGSNANDMDCDGVPTDEDCDDNDPNVGSNANDMDCDGVPTDEDCDDNDPNVGSNANDMDCDGVPTDEDCDDNDPNVGSNANDMDCDGVPTDEDCDDNDPNVGSNANDMDCDGVPTDEDCDDNDPNVGSNANDMDCDGVPTDEDCDDNDPNVGSNANDMDCDGVPTDEDCDDNDPNVGSNANDMDCDGVPTDEDCDDNDPNVGSNANDMDCDGVPTDEDCDDNDPNVGSNANDMDCDGVPTDEDCDDNDPNVGSNANDMDCDGVPTDEDCDDNDPNVGSNANDMDCDGVPTDEDCDDNDPDVGAVGTNPDDMDCDGVHADIDCDDNDPNVTTTNEEATLYCPDPIVVEVDGCGIEVTYAAMVTICDEVVDVDIAYSIPSGSYFEDGTTEVTASYEGLTCTFMVTVEASGTTTPDCTIIGTNEVKLHSDNTVEGNVCQSPSSSMIPPFYANTVSNDSSPDVVVEEGQMVTLTGQNYGKIEVKEGGTLIFTQSNIFIHELKTDKYNTIKFDECANVFINKTLEFDEFSNFNPDMNNVTLYVNDNVKVKKGSTINAHIYANDNDIIVVGKDDSPTNMNGMFVAKKVEGKYTVNWTGVEYCNPCPIEIPDPVADCECDGGIVSVTLAYAGNLSDLSSDDDNASFTDNGDGTFTLATFNGDKLSNPNIFVNGINVGEIHASCSQDILGLVLGDLTVTAYIDQEGGLASIETCPVPPAECDCDGKIVKMSVVYHGTNGATITVGADENGNNSTTYSNVQYGQILDVDLGDIGNWWYYSVNGSVEASIHTSCSDDILGNVNADKSIFGDMGDFPDPADSSVNNGTFLVISHTDSNGNVCSIDYASSYKSAMRSGGATEVDIKPVNSEFSVKAWPNPSSNDFNMSIITQNIKDQVEIRVFDIRNRLINVDRFNWNDQYKFGNKLQAGLYFVRISQGEYNKTFRVMKR